MTRGRYFQYGRGGVFDCRICKRRTRLVDQGADSELCPECWDLAGIDNAVNDSGGDPQGLGDWTSERDRLLAKAVKGGGDPERIKEQFEYLWP